MKMNGIRLGPHHHHLPKESNGKMFPLLKSLKLAFKDNKNNEKILTLGQIKEEVGQEMGLSVSMAMSTGSENFAIISRDQRQFTNHHGKEHTLGHLNHAEKRRNFNHNLHKNSKSSGSSRVITRRRIFGEPSHTSHQRHFSRSEPSKLHVSQSTEVEEFIRRVSSEPLSFWSLSKYERLAKSNSKSSKNLINFNGLAPITEFSQF